MLLQASKVSTDPEASVRAGEAHTTAGDLEECICGLKICAKTQSYADKERTIEKDEKEGRKATQFHPNRMPVVFS